MAGANLMFREVEYTKDQRGVTRKWEVWNQAGDRKLGEVVWHSPWRRYTFHPAFDTLFDVECLMNVSQFLAEQTVEQMKTWRRPRVARR